MKKLGVILGLVFVLAISSRGYAATINVPLGGDIQAAMDGANSGDIIQLASGTYNISSALTLNSGTFKVLTIIGNGVDVTVLDGGSSSQILQIGIFESIYIQDITLSNGSGVDGGGIFGEPFSLISITDAKIYNCNASNNGGGIYVNGCNLSITRLYFLTNHADNDGGAIYYDNYDAFWGGSFSGISCDIIKSSFNGNSSGRNAAAIDYHIKDETGVLNISNSTFGGHAVGNEVVRFESGSGGSAISLNSNTIAHNSIGGLYFVTASHTISAYNNLFIHNVGYDIGSTVTESITGDRNMLESISGPIAFTGINYQEYYSSDVVSSSFALNNGGTVPTLALSSYGIRVAGGRSRSPQPTEDQNGITRRSRSDLGAIEIPQTINVWIGGSGQDWSTAANWSEGVVPTTSHPYIVIDNCNNSNYPINSTPRILFTSQIIIGNFGAFKNTGNLLVNKIYLLSSSGGTGQFLNTATLGGTRELEQYLFPGQWNFLGIPLQNGIDVSTLIPGATLGTSTWGGSSYSYTAGDYWVFEHSEEERANNGHSDFVWKSVNSGPLTSDKGYIVWVDTPQKALFSGTLVPSTSIFDLTFTNLSDSLNSGWCLISNPYLSPFSWVDADETNGISNVDQAAYFYENAFQNYFVIPSDPIYGSTEKVPQIQAFFVKANNNSSPSFTIDPSLLTIDRLVQFKSASIEDKHSLKATLFRDSEKFYDETYIRHKASGLLSFEGDKDAYKMKALSDASPQIYTKGMGTDMTINSFSYYDYPNQELPLYVKVPEVDTFKLAFNIDDSMGDFEYTLEDKLFGDFYNLNNADTLKFKIGNLNEPDRFVLHVVNSATKNFTSNTKESVLIYGSKNKVILKTSKDFSRGFAKVYDVSGKLILKQEINAPTTELYLNNANSQLVIVTYESNRQIFKQKLNMKN